MKAKELLEHVNESDIISLMEDYGSPVYSRGTNSSGEDYLTFQTVCHCGDSHKLYYYSGSKTFYCYTNCGSMSVFDLIKKVEGYSDAEFGKACNSLAERLGIVENRRIGFKSSNGIKQFNEMISKDEYYVNLKQGTRLTEINKFYDESILKYFDHEAFYQGWINEGITEDSMRKFGIAYYWLENHIIIPHYSQSGQLVGIRRRSLNPEDSKNKYMPETIGNISYGHPLGLNLYGLKENSENISRTRMAIITEGEKSVLLSDSFYGGKSVTVATCGFNVSDWQIQALSKLGVEKVYLCFDKDFDMTQESIYMKDQSTWDKYLHYKNRLEVLSNRLASNFTTYLVVDKSNLLNLKDSPFDRGKEVLERLLKESKQIKMQK